MRQHARLPAVMGIMRKHVCQHGCAPRPRFRPSIAAKGFDAGLGMNKGTSEHLATACATFGKRQFGFFLRATSCIERRRELKMRGGKPEPFAADIMHVRKDCRDRTAPTCRQPSAPGSGIEMIEYHLIHALIYGVALDQRLAKIRCGSGRDMRHQITNEYQG